MLCAISGNSIKLSCQREFAYCGLLSMRVRNATNLSNILANYLQTTVRIEMFIPEWLPLSDRIKIGGALYLGQNTSLGNRVLDVNNKIRIIIGICNYELVQPFLLNSAGVRYLANLIQLYIPPVIVQEVTINIKSERKNLSLGTDMGIRLGMYCWLGVPTDAYFSVMLRI